MMLESKESVTYRTVFISELTHTHKLTQIPAVNECLCSEYVSHLYSHQMPDFFC